MPSRPASPPTVACVSRSSGATASHRVTDRPCRAPLACRRISRYGSSTNILRFAPGTALGYPAVICSHGLDRASNHREGPMAEQPAERNAKSLTRRDIVAGVAAALFVPPPLGSRTLGQTPARPTPSAAQLAWQRDELALFTHFGVNTFTDREWGDGREDPAIFNPAGLDPAQWARAAREAGFRAMILTAKHHDGFCLWP